MEKPKLKHRIEKHRKECGSFSSALDLGTILFDDVDEELQIRGGELTQAVNTETKEVYDPSDLTLGFKIFFCPFCGKKLDDKTTPDDIRIKCSGELSSRILANINEEKNDDELNASKELDER
jgi:hypothetical protein